MRLLAQQPKLRVLEQRPKMRVMEQWADGRVRQMRVLAHVTKLRVLEQRANSRLTVCVGCRREAAAPKARRLRRRRRRRAAADAHCETRVSRKRLWWKAPASWNASRKSTSVWRHGKGVTETARRAVSLNGVMESVVVGVMA